MQLTTIARKRSRTHAPLLLALAAAVAVLTCVLTGIDAHVAKTQDAAVAEAITRAPARQAALQITSGVERPEEHVAAQAVVNRVTSAAPTTTSHRFRSDSFAGSAGRTYVAATVPDLADHATLVAGRWAESNGEAAVQADSGLGVGDSVTAGDQHLRVVGTWRVVDPQDARWFADPAMLSGTDREASGPLVVSRATLEALPTFVKEQWTIVPRKAGFGTDDLQSLSEALAAVAADEPPQGVSVEGQLLEHLDAVNRSAKAAHALAVVALVVVGVVGMVALLQLLGLLGDVRQREAELLRGRGASVSQLARWHGLDVALVAVAAAAAGAGLVAVTVGRPSLLLTGGSAAPAVILGPLFAARRAGRVTAHVQRETNVALGSITLLASAAAALTLGQFLTYGSAITTTADGRPATDPLTVAAPAVTLIAGGLLGALAAGPLTGLAARSSAGRRGLTMVLGLRQIARRPRTFGVVVALAAIIVGNALTASVYAGTARAVERDVMTAVMGSDVRAELEVDTASPTDTTAGDARRFASLPGVKATTPAVTGVARIDQIDVPLLALDASAIDALTATGPLGAVVTTSVADTLGLDVGERFDLVMPSGSGQLTMVVRDVVRVIPGLATDGGVLVDLAAVQSSLSQQGDPPAKPNLFLLGTDEPSTVAAGIAAASSHPADISISEPEGALGQSATNAWMLSTIGLIMLGLVGVIAATVALAGRRAGEVRMLRALGLRAADQRRARLAELATALVVGAVAGVMTSVVVIAATVPGLARAPWPSRSPAVPVSLEIDLTTLAIACAVAFAGLVLTGWFYSRAVSRQARELVRGEST